MERKEDCLERTSSGEEGLCSVGKEHQMERGIVYGRNIKWRGGTALGKLCLMFER